MFVQFGISLWQGCLVIPHCEPIILYMTYGHWLRLLKKEKWVKAYASESVGYLPLLSFPAK